MVEKAFRRLQGNEMRKGKDAGARRDLSNTGGHVDKLGTDCVSPFERFLDAKEAQMKPKGATTNPYVVLFY